MARAPSASNGRATSPRELIGQRAALSCTHADLNLSNVAPLCARLAAQRGRGGSLLTISHPLGAQRFHVTREGQGLGLEPFVLVS